MELSLYVIAYGLTRRSSMRDKLRNYKLFNNKIDRSDFGYVLNPFNLNAQTITEFFLFPLVLQPYDIVSQYFMLLLGEESKRLFQPLVIAINDDSIAEKQNQKKTVILQMLEEVMTKIAQDPNNPDILAEVDKYSNYTPKMMVESVSTHLLNHFYRQENLDKIFNDCFKDVLICGEELVRVDKVGDGVQVTRVNPVEVWFQLANNLDTIDEAEKIYERNLMTVSEIIDEYYEFLTPDQIDWLESYGQAANGLYNYGDAPFMIPEVDSIYTFESSTMARGIPVHRCRWKSKKKQGIWSFPDTNGEIQELIVDEGFKAPKGTVVKWMWINEYWEGIKIGSDMYLHKKTGPRKQQFRSIDNLSKCKSGYAGTVYSATNAQGVSLMDRLVPWVYMYLILWYRTELAIAKNMGKIALIDLSLVSYRLGKLKKWAILWFPVWVILFVNTFNEENKSTGGLPNQSTQNRALDLETGNYIQGHISLLQFIEEKNSKYCWNYQTKTRKYQYFLSLVGNTERAVVQSSHITEPYFAPHEFFKKRVCEYVIEVAKECLAGKTKNFQYITDDLSTVLFEIDGDKLANF